MRVLNLRGRKLVSSRVVSLVEVKVVEGEGTTENVVREVTYYFTTDGELVAMHDPGQRYDDYQPSEEKAA